MAIPIPRSRASFYACVTSSRLTGIPLPGRRRKPGTRWSAHAAGTQGTARLPICLEHSSTTRVYLGNAIFIAPIVEPGEHLRQVGLPEGGWYDFWEDTFYEGGISTDILPQLERIPVFIRAGSLIPLQEGATLQLHIYTSQPDAVTGNLAQYTGSIYSDSGDGYGPWRLDNFTIKQSEGSLSITWESQGEYPLPYERVEIKLHGARPVKALVDNQETGISSGVVNTVQFNKAQIMVSSC